MKRTLPVSLLVPAAIVLLRCSSSDVAPPPTPQGPQLQPGELCDATNSAALKITFDPPTVVVAPGQSRPVRAILAPDICSPVNGTFALADTTVAAGPPAQVSFDLRHATYDFEVRGVSAGATGLSLSLQRAIDSAPTTGTLQIDVRDATPPTCDPGGAASAGNLDANDSTVSGSAAPLDDASVSAPSVAFTRTDEFALQPFGASVACAGDLAASAPGKPLALGPAVTFSATSVYTASHPLRREIDFAIPVNPAAFPTAARMRHLQVLYQGPRATTPRAIAVASPRIEKVAGKNTYVLRFTSPWLGTYQAAVAPDAGTHHRKRHLTHRAVMGFSMGGGAAASFGFRHHDKLDAIGAMGGPSDWSWLTWYIETYILGGFCTAANPNCTKYAPNMYPIEGPYVHTQDFDNWYFQPSQGSGGTFDRHEYAQLFWDLTAMMGNPAGQQDPAVVENDQLMSLFPAGPTADDPYVKGDPTGLPTLQGAAPDCRLVIDPISGDPDQDAQRQIQAQCYRTRCDPASTWKAPSGYYDDEYNPDGSQQVISVCDGNRAGGEPPYANKWAPPTPDTAIPMSAALAVDLNKNGVRDANEPIIRSGREPWSDWGTDGKPDSLEAGYDPIANPDPAQDDYDYQLNPNGTEGDHRFQDGEPYKDVGLDGVASTKQVDQGGYDFGEGDGKYTQAAGLTNFQEQDPHSVVHQWSKSVPGGPLTDDALARLDVLVDGGIRDLFNFSVVGDHLAGTLAGRGKRVAYYNNFDFIPGEVIGQPENFQPADVRWADMAEVPDVRVGLVDATPMQIAQGDGAHVGTGLQILSRVEMGFYFAARSWTDADRTLTDVTASHPETTTINELGTGCEIQGRCEKIFTGPGTHRTGPIAVTLPPGYALEENRLRDVRYPVLFVLHGYGQDPRDLEAVAIITNNFMNDGLRSYATRLPKFLVVYVDGRCRVQNGKPECVRGTFYMNSDRPDGPQLDTWFTEVMDYVDQNYRTMKPTDVDVTD